jgi:signal transduction histidine kinase
MSVQTLTSSPRETPPHAGDDLPLVLPQDSVPERIALENDYRALLNILEDSAAEKSGLERGQRAMLNIFEDFEGEKAGLDGAQRAVLNILDDFSTEKAQLEAAQRSVLNILDDFSEERAHLRDTQRAELNILEDFDEEKAKVELVNQQLEREVEDRKRVEAQVQRVNRELLASNKELEAFSYSVSHDLRAPLRSIDGFSQALLEDCADALDERGKSYLHRVRAAAQRMGSLIDDFLNLAKVTRAEVHVERLSISNLARSVAAELQKTQPERQVDFQIEDGLEAAADTRLLRIVLENLLGNAWKFTSKRTHATIQIGAVEAKGAHAYFVRDNGAGFDASYAERLFGAFQRLHAMTEFPGTGVGLATVQRIIQRHGGRVWAEGVVDRGATFYFTLAETPLWGGT